jgi:hypothetical protein
MNSEVSLAYIGTFENIATNLSQRSVALNGKTLCPSQCFFIYLHMYITPVPEKQNVIFYTTESSFWRTLESFY